MALKKLLGNRVREMRRAKGWTQTEFAAQIEMDYRYVGAIERGEVNITIDNIERVAAGFGIPAYQLFLFSTEEKELDDGAVREGLALELFSGMDEGVKRALVGLLKAIR